MTAEVLRESLPQPMPEDVADAIYRDALTPAYRRAVGAEATDEDAGHLTGPAVLRMCPCQWGTCHGCQTGHHAGCVRGRIVTRAAYIIGTRGDVTTVPVDGGRTRVFAAVWLSGRQCGWRCGCGCVDPAEQGDLFALAGGAR